MTLSFIYLEMQYGDGGSIASLYVMAGVYIMAGLAHFIKPAFYTRIIPPYLPYALVLVYVSGVAEIILGVCLLFSTIRSIAAWGIMIMLIAFLPVHLYMIRSDRFKKIPSWVLWARLFLQAGLIYWAYQFV